MKTTQRVYCDDNMSVLKSLKDESVDLVYTDPPFNTKKSQKMTRIRVEANESGERTGFGGRKYRSTTLGTQEFSDSFKFYRQIVHSNFKYNPFNQIVLMKYSENPH